MTEDTNPVAGKVEYVPLKVTSGILVHIGAGIYSSVAGALKELVSNAYDADATQVNITTNYPEFDEIRVVDNGSGMGVTRFKQAMQSIGSSMKGTLETRNVSPVYQRPIIGKMGIGLMALSQVCDEALIESQMDGARFTARLDFSEFKSREEQQVKLNILRQQAEQYGGLEEIQRLIGDDTVDTDRRAGLQDTYEQVLQAEKILKEQNIESDEGENLGYCVIYPDLHAIPGQNGTIVTLKKIEGGVKNLLQDHERSLDAIPRYYRDKGLEWSQYRDEVNSYSWIEICERLRVETGGSTYQSLPQYHQFLWELSLMTPVGYYPESPVLIAPTILEWKKAELTKFQFSLHVDNRQLFKPVLLPSGDLVPKMERQEEEWQKNLDYYLEEFNFEDQVDEESLSYRGYIFWQRKQVKPSTIRGIQIYIRNVGIGSYDHTLMNFSTVNPTSRAGQMSGEIYVEKGLERALNIDRNSFRETDAHYLKLQENLWQILGSATRGDGVIGKSVDAYWQRKDIQEKAVSTRHLDQLNELVKSVSNDSFTLRSSEEESEEPYKSNKGEIILYDNSPKWPNSREQRLNAQRILLAIKAAVETGASSYEVLKLLENLLLK